MRSVQGNLWRSRTEGFTLRPRREASPDCRLGPPRLLAPHTTGRFLNHVGCVSMSAGGTTSGRTEFIHLPAAATAGFRVWSVASELARWNKVARISPGRRRVSPSEPRRSVSRCCGNTLSVSCSVQPERNQTAKQETGNAPDSDLMSLSSSEGSITLIRREY